MKLLIINCVSDLPEVNLYRGLVSRGVDLTLFYNPQDSQSERYSEWGISAEPLHIAHRFDFKAIFTIRKTINANTFDVVYAPTSRGISTTLLAVRGMKKPPRLVTYRGTMGHISPYSILSRLSHLNYRVDSIVCNCHAVKDYLLFVGAEPKKLSVVYKGHEAEAYQSEPMANRASFGVETKEICIGFVANLRPLKGGHVLLEAFSQVAREIAAKLLVVGDVGNSSLPAMAESLGISESVRFLGVRKDAIGILRMCDFSVMPSLEREGVARAVVESLALGVPVIVSNVGGLPETVQHEKTGLVVASGSILELREALLRLGSEPMLRRQLGQRAEGFVRSELSVDRYVDSMLRVFKGELLREQLGDSPLSEVAA